VRSAPNAEALEKSDCAGPDGSAESFFDAQGIDFEMSGPGLLQYKAILATRNPAKSPYLKQVVITRQ
jgi:hypothetical protein